MALVDVKELLDAGVHYGHRASRWNPKMRPYIYGKRNLMGIRDMIKLPDALVIVGPNREHIAVKEAKRMGVTTIALIDTDSDPDPVDLPIPGNDDSIRSIEVILGKLADACLEGRAALPPEQQGLIKPRQPRPQAAETNPSPAPTVV